MSLPREKMTELSLMSLDDLYELVGRETYLSAKRMEVMDFSLKQRYDEERIRNVFRDIAPKIEIVAERENLIRSAKRLLFRLRGDLRKKICKDWNYCKKKGRYSDEIALSQVLVGLVGSVIKGLPVTGAYGVAFILIKKGLDKFCRCPVLRKGRAGL